ncbi:pentatricopeptide repeat-containing protein At1g11290, chloroplastic-like [Selaginella moellendorffii]|uniref:pentatricopeptide repeat-containing protein At1g11290, chloroplastic-like n=1 Tax=Selaginella moellendorffii TaxID=88036 RepID=UPI000D1CE1F0|nr:pentatricopeptide repeat-containing protein At1g11290, chloroplastic-like [Selaginella moellendorffii]|eukprot:XP_024523865.1 pentatricopeptide repeat-containing protein At1g11290, chloroplastic-like [Selaginella moellendorffii]
MAPIQLDGDGRKRDLLSGKNIGLINAIIDGFAKRGMMDDARRIFDSMDRRTAASWNCVIDGYPRSGQPDLSLLFFGRLHAEGLDPNGRSFCAALHACSSMAATEKGVTYLQGRIIKLRSLKRGLALHSQLQSGGFLVDRFVASALVDFYGKCGTVREALEIFQAAKLGTKDVVLWSAMISACSQGGEDELALELFELMLLEDGVEANARTLVAVLDACTNLGWLDRGGEIYSKFARTGTGISSSVFVSNSLMDMYAKWGRLLDCQRVFDGMLERDSVSWNVLIMGYAKGGEAQRAVELFTAMQALDVVVSSRTLVAVLQACLDMAEKEEARLVDGRPLKVASLEKGLAFHFRFLDGLEDVYAANNLISLYAWCGSLDDAARVFDKMTFASVLKACGGLGALQAGQAIHRLIEETGAESSPAVANSLISFYGKCGDMVESRRVFDGFPDKDAVSWSALIAGYSRQGDSDAVFDLFERMQEFAKPDAVTFSSVLSVCCHAGLVDKGMEYFHAMCSDYGLSPSVEHVISMVDLLGRANRLEDALAMVQSLPVEEVCSRIWMALLGACFKWKNAVIGEVAFDALPKVDDQGGTAYALMANIYSGSNNENYDNLEVIGT